jgi:hypothetical protein
LLALLPLTAFWRPPSVAAPALEYNFRTVTEDSASLGGPSEGPKAVFSETRFEFGELESGTIVEHEFVLKNEGSAPLLIQKVSMMAPLLVTRMPHEIAAGTEGAIHFKLDTATLAGRFEGSILVFLNDPALPQANLTLAGRVVRPIELTPMPAFFVAGQRGRGNRAAIEIVNHEQEPLRIEKIAHPTERFTTRLETLKQGQRYRLTLTLKPDGPSGKSMEPIVIRTSSKKMPVLKLDANTYLFERVHNFPEVVNFGMLHVGEARGAALTLMIYEEGGADFQLKLNTDVPFLSLQGERGQKGDRYQVKITLIPEKIQLGPIKGSIIIDTNDREFPRVVVPVSGQIVER